MKSIPGKILSFRGNSDSLLPLSVDQIRMCSGYSVDCYSKLVASLAKLACANPDLLLLMRGQSRDYQVNRKTTLLPSIYRDPPSNEGSYGQVLESRYDTLRKKEDELKRLLYGRFQRRTDYPQRIWRSELALWAILQHYEVCHTPLLDVTQSALVACSFCFLDDQGRIHSQGSNRGFFYLYVLGVPQISGSITVSPHQELQVVRLSGVCPPDTLRPYFQEGFLLGTYPSVDSHDVKSGYSRDEMDCALRLVAKFKIKKSDSFWDNGFSALDKCAVYPPESNDLCTQISNLPSSDTHNFSHA